MTVRSEGPPIDRFSSTGSRNPPDQALLGNQHVQTERRRRQRSRDRLRLGLGLGLGLGLAYRRPPHVRRTRPRGTHAQPPTFGAPDPEVGRTLRVSRCTRKMKSRSCIGDPLPRRRGSGYRGVESDTGLTAARRRSHILWATNHARRMRPGGSITTTIRIRIMGTDPPSLPQRGVDRLQDGTISRYLICVPKLNKLWCVWKVGNRLLWRAGSGVIGVGAWESGLNG